MTGDGAVGKVCSLSLLLNRPSSVAWDLPLTDALLSDMSAHLLHHECFSRRIHSHSVCRFAIHLPPRLLSERNLHHAAYAMRYNSILTRVTLTPVSLAASTTTPRVSWLMESQLAWDFGILRDRKITTDSDLFPTLRPMSSSSASRSSPHHHLTTFAQRLVDT